MLHLFRLCFCVKCSIFTPSGMHFTWWFQHLNNVNVNIWVIWNIIPCLDTLQDIPSWFRALPATTNGHANLFLCCHLSSSVAFPASFSFSKCEHQICERRQLKQNETRNTWKKLTHSRNLLSNRVCIQIICLSFCQCGEFAAQYLSNHQHRNLFYSTLCVNQRTLHQQHFRLFYVGIKCALHTIHICKAAIIRRQMHRHEYVSLTSHSYTLTKFYLPEFMWMFVSLRVCMCVCMLMYANLCQASFVAPLDIYRFLCRNENTVIK